MRITPIFFVLLSGLAVGQAIQVKPTLQVVVISISSFDDDNYKNPTLEQGIEASTKELTDFISSHFPDAVLTVKKTPEDTTTEALVTFFKGDFQDIINGNVTLLFVLSHGEYVPFRNKAYGNDLYIVTKNTDSHRVRERALSLTTDILPKTSGLKDGTILLAFIDTCHAGAASNYGIDLQGISAELAGMKMMFMGASLSDQLSFQASFTDALVKLWQEDVAAGSCTSPEQSPQLLRARIRKDLAEKGLELDSNDGFPTVLIHYHGSLCLENLAVDKSLVLVQNATDDSLVARFSDKQGKLPPYEEPVDQHQSSLLSLPHGIYSLDFYASNTQKEHHEINLSSSFVYEQFGVPTPSEFGEALTRASYNAAAAGSSEETVIALRRRAYSAFVAGKDEIGAARVASLLGPGDSPLGAVPGSGPGVSGYERLFTVGQKLILEGQFHEGSEKLTAAAKLAPAESDQSVAAAVSAYYAAAADGNPKRAMAIRKEFAIPSNTLCEGCLDLEKSARFKNSAATETFRSEGVVGSLTEGQDTITEGHDIIIIKGTDIAKTN